MATDSTRAPSPGPAAAGPTRFARHRRAERPRTPMASVPRRWRAAAVRMFSRAMDDNLRGIAQILGEHPGPIRMLDLGCWDGSNTIRYAAAGASVFGIERSTVAAAQARGRGIETASADLNAPLPFRAESFDVVSSNQVIEHLSDTDQFVAEAFRVLRPGGILVCSTENLASWHNVASLMFGWQAFSLTNVSRTGFGLGNPLANLRGEEPLDPGWEHLRIFSYRGLAELAAAHGFVDVRVVGAGYYPLPSACAHVDPRHAAFITVGAAKPHRSCEGDVPRLPELAMLR